MRIVMLGHSNVGKTTYMAALYSYFNPKSMLGFRRRKMAHGFHVRATTPGARSYLSKCASDLGKGAFPTATDRLEEYPFVLRFDEAKKDLLGFTWVDYRGGALTDSAENSEEVTRLHQVIKDADGIMVFADSSAIGRNDHKVKSEIRRLTNFIGNAVNTGSKLIPIVIALTKADLLAPDGPAPREVFRSLIESIDAATHLVGISTLLSCITPMHNVHAPLLFCVGASVAIQEYTLKERIIALEAEAERLSSQAEGAAAKANIFNSIGSWFTGEKSYETQRVELYTAVKSSLESALRKRNELQALLKPAERIRDIVLEQCNRGDLALHGNLSLIGLKWT